MLITGSCTKNNQSIQTPAIVSQPIKGSAVLIDDNDLFLTDHSGTTVTVENTSPQIKVQVNNKGLFELPLQSDTASTTIIAFEHPGYGTIRKYYTRGQLSDSGGPKLVMHPVSKVIVNALSASIADDKLQLVFNVSVPAGTTNNYIAWIFRKNNPVISTQDGWGYRSVAVKDGDNTIKICMCPEECGYFQKGDTMYLKGFGSVSPKYDGFTYGDNESNKLILACANASGNCATVALAIP